MFFRLIYPMMRSTPWRAFYPQGWSSFGTCELSFTSVDPPSHGYPCRPGRLPRRCGTPCPDCNLAEDQREKGLMMGVPLLGRWKLVRWAGPLLDSWQWSEEEVKQKNSSKQVCYCCLLVKSTEIRRLDLCKKLCELTILRLWVYVDFIEEIVCDLCDIFLISVGWGLTGSCCSWLFSLWECQSVDWLLAPFSSMWSWFFTKFALNLVICSCISTKTKRRRKKDFCLPKMRV